MTLLSEGTISNSGGGTTGKRESLTLTFRETEIPAPTLPDGTPIVGGKPTYTGYWEVTWG